MREPPLYRPFALLAFGAAVLVGAPLGLALLAALHLDAPALRREWALLHASVQIFGFFGTLIVGVAHHLLPRFTGRAVAPSSLTRPLAVLLGAALLVRVLGTATGAGALIAAAAVAQTVAFTAFAAWVWRVLDPPPLSLLRWHLTVASGWLAAACALDAVTRAASFAAGLAGPDLAVMSAAHTMGLGGGVVGWVLGVLLRAGPMFVAGWNVPVVLARAVPLALAAGVAFAVASLGPWPASARGLLARLGELVPLATVAAVALGAGVLRPARGGLPMLSRPPQEARLFRLGLASAAAALVLALASIVPGLAPLGAAVRHLTTIGFLSAVAIAMAFRLVPVLESAPLRWPRLRAVAFWTLLAGVLLRAGDALIGFGVEPARPMVALSGLLAWTALACAAANLTAAVRRSIA